jgi:glycosyltransferase involved in cell wall biosynthesis
MRKSFEERCPDVGNRPYILFLSRIHEKKGLHLLIQAYRRLSINGINLPLLVIAGPGIESAYGQRLKQGIESEKLSSHFYFASMLAGDAKWGAFYGCEAFILPSHQENFGIAVVEALACGKPVLISDQVNIWQEIAQASAGMVAGDSIEGCQQLLEQWHGLDREAKEMMGARARNCYEQNFAVRPAAERLLQALSGELYQQ